MFPKVVFWTRERAFTPSKQVGGGGADVNAMSVFVKLSLNKSKNKIDQILFQKVLNKSGNLQLHGSIYQHSVW